MRVLITGVTGFAGSHLAEFILAEHPDAEIFGTMRWRSRTENIRDIESKIQLLECDLRDLSSAKQLMERVRPDRIFHLAAQSFVPSSWNAPAESLTTNIIGQLNVFEAVRAMKTEPWIQIACSSEEYGMVYENELPIKETNPLRPLSPYAVSKVGQDYLGYQYCQSFGLKVIRTRGFNHDGPRRGDVFVSSNFAKQIVMIEKGKKPPVMYVGNLEARRDFTDVRDMGSWLLACARRQLWCRARPTTCAAAPITAFRTSSTSSSRCRARKWRCVKIPSACAPPTFPWLLGDASKFKAVTGWEPIIPYEQTLQDMLDYWRAEIS